jgi:hypothetical protein
MIVLLLFQGSTPMKTTLIAAGILLCAALSARAETLTVLTPPVGEKAYQIAGEAFVDLWQKVTDKRLPLKTWDKASLDNLPEGDLVLIGSDAVQPLVHRLILDAAIETLNIQYGGDGYRIVCVPHQNRRFLILAGGSGRSTLYAVYDFFRRQAGAEYFWDGDVIPKQSQIAFDKLDVTEQPHFEYRGLRYFAHRGLHRFQAEHWDLDDWKREIDWMLKKRFNLFMLRIGIDDLFQRAFADVPYPPTDDKDPDGVDRSYDDRTSFWQLRYRGELRKAVLRYAFDRGLLHPEDTGTPTHWYSHTPSAFFKNRPGFPVTTDQKSGYSLATHQIWDIEDQRAWDGYWQLTAAHIREFGTPRMFHTIGLAERTFGKDARDNLQRKLYVYHKTQQMLREHYPDAPLIIAGWDFIAWWKDPDVQRLLKEFDPQKTLVFDYTADDVDKLSFRDWNLLNNFPWMFGIFHSYARNSDVHEDYSLLAERLRMASADEKCRGLFIWSEISHSDTFLLEYLGANSWKPTEELPVAVNRFCRGRYPGQLAGAMESLWKDFLVTSQSVHWSHGWGPGGGRWNSFGETHFRMLTTGVFSSLSPQRLMGIRSEYERIGPSLKPASDVLSRLSAMSATCQNNPLWRRDALDMGRTIASRAMLASLLKASLDMDAWREGKADPARIRKLAELTKGLLDSLGDVTAQSDDFSMYASLKRLERAQPLGGVEPKINAHTEQTLKSNAENDYCRSHHYELVRHVYRPELDVYWVWVEKRLAAGDKSPWRRPKEFGTQAKAIADKFYATPLAELAPGKQTTPPLADVLTRLSAQVREVVAELARP